jgi:hypothetical protein
MEGCWWASNRSLPVTCVGKDDNEDDNADANLRVNNTTTPETTTNTSATRSAEADSAWLPESALEATVIYATAELLGCQY